MKNYIYNTKLFFKNMLSLFIYFTIRTNMSTNHIFVVYGHL